MRDLFRGKLVRLTSEEPDVRAKAEVQWQRDTEFHRLASSDPISLESEKKLRERFEKQSENGFGLERYPFAIRTLQDDKHIGYFFLLADLIHNEAWVGIGIGDRDFWGKGYGTDMMNLCLQYAFTELNMHRVSLGLHEYNPRALRSYEKAGFRLEGRTRKDLVREGKRYDTLWMGILRDEWMELQQQERENMR
jgi:RimJ/RimL family protein N-acetyltransferase